MLFGDLNKINKEAERYFSHQRYLELSKKAEDAQDYIGAGKLQKLADELYGLFDPDKKDMYEASMYFEAVVIKRTSNVEVLKKQQIENKPQIIDIEFDEID